MDKQGIDAPEFLHDLENWIHEHLDVAGIFVKKNKTLGLESIIDPYFGDSKKDMTKELELNGWKIISKIHGNDDISSYHTIVNSSIRLVKQLSKFSEKMESIYTLVTILIVLKRETK